MVLNLVEENNMSNIALASVKNSLSMWEDNEKLREIRKLFAPKLTDMEFQFFVGMGKATNLNPFLREIWAVKYSEKEAAQIFIGRDGYRKSAQSHRDYDYHQCDAVYENDDFEMNDGIIKHKYNLKNRGELLGAYCIAKRKNSERPSYVFAELREYSTGKSLWREPGLYKNDKGYMSQGGKPATMIKKVAESQCLRAGFQELFAGSYGEEEMESVRHEDGKPIVLHGNTQTEKLKNILDDNVIDADTGEVIDAPKQNHEMGSYEILISTEQMEQITSLMSEKEFSPERIKKALAYHKVDELRQLTDAQARIFLLQLEKV
jgi:phage recombination protein Bet